MAKKKSGQYWVLGATFLKKYYTVFDLETQAIGLSRSNYIAPTNDAIFSWTQIKYFALRGCMLACCAYIIYDLVIVRVLQSRYHICVRKSTTTKRINHKKRSKELKAVDNEAELSLSVNSD